MADSRRTLAWNNRGTVFFLLFAFCFHNVGGTREVIAQLSGGNPRFPETGIKVRNARGGGEGFLPAVVIHNWPRLGVRSVPPFIPFPRDSI